jgi:hypothetical protein
VKHLTNKVVKKTLMEYKDFEIYVLTEYYDNMYIRKYYWNDLECTEPQGPFEDFTDTLKNFNSVMSIFMELSPSLYCN